MSHRKANATGPYIGRLVFIRAPALAGGLFHVHIHRKLCCVQNDEACVERDGHGRPMSDAFCGLGICVQHLATGTALQKQRHARPAPMVCRRITGASVSCGYRPWSSPKTALRDAETTPALIHGSGTCRSTCVRNTKSVGQGSAGSAARVKEHWLVVQAPAPVRLEGNVYRLAHVNCMYLEQEATPVSAWEPEVLTRKVDKPPHRDRATTVESTLASQLEAASLATIHLPHLELGANGKQVLQQQGR